MFIGVQSVPTNNLMQRKNEELSALPPSATVPLAFGSRALSARDGRPTDTGPGSSGGANSGTTGGQGTSGGSDSDSSLDRPAAGAGTMHGKGSRSLSARDGRPTDTGSGSGGPANPGAGGH